VNAYCASGSRNNFDGETCDALRRGFIGLIGTPVDVRFPPLKTDHSPPVLPMESVHVFRWDQPFFLKFGSDRLNDLADDWHSLLLA
jgi:hypothetical protein